MTFPARKSLVPGACCGRVVDFQCTQLVFFSPKSLFNVHSLLFGRKANLI